MVYSGSMTRLEYRCWCEVQTARRLAALARADVLQYSPEDFKGGARKLWSIDGVDSDRVYTCLPDEVPRNTRRFRQLARLGPYKWYPEWVIKTTRRSLAKSFIAVESRQAYPQSFGKYDVLLRKYGANPKIRAVIAILFFVRLWVF